MPTFQCSECRRSYFDSGNYTSCPFCAGLGAPDPACTCPHVRVLFGTRSIGGPLSTNPECPLHGLNKEPK